MTIQEKIQAYCAINDIAGVDSRCSFADTLQGANTFAMLYAWNIDGFLAEAIWDLLHGKVEEEEFFQIGDSVSSRVIKHPQINNASDLYFSHMPEKKEQHKNHQTVERLSQHAEIIPSYLQVCHAIHDLLQEGKGSNALFVIESASKDAYLATSKDAHAFDKLIEQLQKVGSDVFVM